MPTSRADDPPDSLRLRSCYDPGCRALFTICAGCDRGQRYCSVACRQRMRRQQVRAAGRRYQASPKGKLRHSLRQRAYRRRQSQADVTHHPARSITNSRGHEPRRLSQCVKCLRHSAWIDPFSDFRPPQRRQNRPRAPARRSRSTGACSKNFIFSRSATLQYRELRSNASTRRLSASMHLRPQSFRLASLRDYDGRPKLLRSRWPPFLVALLIHDKPFCARGQHLKRFQELDDGILFSTG